VATLLSPAATPAADAFSSLGEEAEGDIYVPALTCWREGISLSAATAACGAMPPSLPAAAAPGSYSCLHYRRAGVALA